MGYVTKVVSEYVGDDVSVSTSIHFECYEDFLKYENSINVINVKAEAEEPIPDEDGWVNHIGNGLPSHLKILRVDILYKDGTRMENKAPSEWCGWEWSEEKEGNQVLKYRIHKENE